jgi:hypothetical protein
VFALNFREQIAGIKQVLVDELDQLAASAQARWYAQHDADGGHTQVRAARVETPSLRLSAPLLRYEIDAARAAGSDAAPVRVDLPRGTTLVELYVDPTAPDVGHVKEIVVPGAVAGDLLCVVWSGTSFLHSSARTATGVAPPAYTERLGDRLRLIRAQTAVYTLGPYNYRVQDATNPPNVATFLRMDAYDSDISLSAGTHPCWVQIA